MPGPGQDERDGTMVARAMDDVRGALPWQSVLGSMALLGSHDTARWRSMARSDELALVGLGLLMTVPGSPCFLYGDEVGLTAPDNELARSPMPWDESQWDRSWLATYRQWIRLRSGSAALAHGGFRWVERTPDSLTFLRESLGERLLVHAAGPPWARRSRSSCSEPVRSIASSAMLTTDVHGGMLTLAAATPGVTVWRSPDGS
jgi:alpha-glucosidase